MPRTNITVTPAPGIGTGVEAVKVAGDSANDHKVANHLGSRVLVVAINGLVAKTLTVKGLDVADDIVTAIGENKSYVIGPLPASLYTQNSGADVGYVQIDLDTSANLTLFAVSF